MSEPGIGIEALDRAFDEVARHDAPCQCIAEGLRFTEGPVWRAAHGDLLFSDIPAERIYRWAAGQGLSVWREGSRGANGNTVDHRGLLVTCEHGARRVSRTDEDGGVWALADRYEGRRLNSPNDVVVKRDGTIWFTDPPYGIKPEERELDGNYVFRIDPGAREPVKVAAGLRMPNGLCFSPDERFLYVADSDREVCEVRRFAVGQDNSLAGGLDSSGGELFARVSPGLPDGIRVDAAGRLYSTAGDGVQVFLPDGRLIGKIRTPEAASNCRFGGADLKTLFITARTRVWRVELGVRGIV